MLHKLKEVLDYRELLTRLVYQNLHQRYQGSVLGFLWTLLAPLLVFISFSIIFTALNNWNLRDYGVYFFAGYVVWIFFSNTCLMACDSIIGNPIFVARVYVPKALLPLASVAVNFVDLMAAFVVLAIIMLAVGAHFSVAMLFLPISTLLVLLFVTGASMVCAVANVFFRDFRHMLGSLLFIWFFFSPILWKAEAAPEKARLLLGLNPIVPFLAMFQYPIWKGTLPPAGSIVAAASYAGVALVMGLLAFYGTERRFYYYL